MLVISPLGRIVISSSRSTKDFFSLLTSTLVHVFRPPWKIKEIVRQIDFIANQSVVIIVFCVSSAAMVTILESSYHMKLVVQNDSMVPGFASLLILRELGSVVMALLLVSRVGAGMAAEIATMQITEQVDALKILGLDPVRFLVVPRFIASTIAGLILSVFANVICLICAMLVSQVYLNTTAGAFVAAAKTFITFQDLMFAVIKGGVFGAIIPLVACYCGFRSAGGAEGVGMSTTQSVVISSVLIIFFDLVLSWVFTHFY